MTLSQLRTVQSFCPASLVGASVSEPYINVLNASGVCMYVHNYVFARRAVNFVFVE